MWNKIECGREENASGDPVYKIREDLYEDNKSGGVRTKESRVHYHEQFTSIPATKRVGKIKHKGKRIEVAITDFGPELS